MIRSFADRDTERLWAREHVGRFPGDLRRTMLRKLLVLDGAISLRICGFPRAIASRSCVGIGPASTACASTTNGASAFAGWTGTRKTSRSSTITRGNDGQENRSDSPRRNPPRGVPSPARLSQYRLAHAISVPPRRINEIVHGKRAVSADTALRLSRFFGNSAQFWLNLQARFDLETERDRLGARLEQEVEVFAAAG